MSVNEERKCLLDFLLVLGALTTKWSLGVNLNFLYLAPSKFPLKHFIFTSIFSLFPNVFLPLIF